MSDENTIVQEFISSARELYAEGHLSEASQMLHQAAAININQFETLHLLGEAAIEMKNEDLAISLFNQALVINPNITSAHYNLGHMHMTREENDKAIECFRKAIQIDPGFFHAQYNLGALLNCVGKFEEALACYKKCIEIHPSDPGQVDLLRRAYTQEKILEEALKSDYLDTTLHAVDNFHTKEFFLEHKKSLEQKRGDQKIILVVSFPKSGSTFLANSLLALTEYTSFRLCYRYDQNEHELYLPYLSMWNKHGVLSLLHMKGTKPNIELIQLFGIRPIITIRNIYDSVASLFKNLNEGKLDSTRARGYSSFWQDQPIQDLPDDRKVDFLIDMAVPWCINYYVSWDYYTKTGQIDAKWVSFENQMENWNTTVRDLCNFVGIGENYTDKAISSLQQPISSPYNSSKAGGSNSLLSIEQKKKIIDMVSYYPDVDFAEHGFLNRDPDGYGGYSLNL